MSVYYQGDGIRLLLGDVRRELATVGAGTVQTCVTSPPYWGLRQYLFDKATVLRDDLTQEEVVYVTSELEKRGIQPRQ